MEVIREMEGPLICWFNPSQEEWTKK